MTHKQILGGRGSAKPFTTLNSIKLKLELDQLKAENEELKNFHINLVGVKECEIKELVKYKQALTEIKEIAYELTNEEYTDFIEEKQAQILQKCEVLDE